jgi:hypothetical protein
MRWKSDVFRDDEGLAVPHSSWVGKDTAGFHGSGAVELKSTDADLLRCLRDGELRRSLHRTCRRSGGRVESGRRLSRGSPLVRPRAGRVRLIEVCPSQLALALGKSVVLRGRCLTTAWQRGRPFHPFQRSTTPLGHLIDELAAEGGSLTPRTTRPVRALPVR